ncbi:MAG: glycoside hydrolase family 78 protein [Dysgonamonadaceae bacterium]|jgi:alpha-L-rhamnosidase|nr:glycoside hydrolase family 78 protein [Dysgonamonadaceae bacterium]
MQNTLKILFLSAIALLAACKGAITTDSIQVTDLTCEYLKNPLSIDELQPRLSWKILQSDSAEQGQRQTAYQILVASTPELLAENQGDLWASGKVRSSQAIQIVYNGSKLETLQNCYWKVRVWNNRGEVSAWSEPACWRMGILNANQWQGEWIGAKPDEGIREYRNYLAENYNKKDFDTKRWINPPCPPSPLLRKTFEVRETDSLVRATLYASALGYYELWFNGERVGDCLQSPEWTNYADYVQYQTFDLTDKYKKGENVLAATLSDGWAIGRMGGIKWNYCFPHRGFYALDRRLMAQLVLEMKDGSCKIIPTDKTWKIREDGYIFDTDNFIGETIDARKIPAGWMQSGFDDSQWENVFVDTNEKRNLVAQLNEPIRVHAELKPVKIWKVKDKYLVDFGQNIAGHCALKIKGKAGQKITLRHAEWLENGEIYTESLGFAKATDTFILSGGDDFFDPGFTYHGFQYVEVSGLTAPLTEDMITARAVSSSPDVTGEFECSNSGLNKLFRNIFWTQRNNMFSVMTDNPSRDERTGATGDIQVFSQTAIFNMNMAAFFKKLVRDYHDIADNGQFFSMIPSLRMEGFWKGWVGAPGWCEAGLIIPWRMYENYGDIDALRSLYPDMKNHIDATLRENPDLVWRIRHNHNNDWLNANTINNMPDTTYNNRRGGTPDDVFSTAFFAYSSRLLSEIAATLNHTDDARHYGLLADSIKNKFIEEYVKDDGYVDGNSQAAYSLALYYDLIPENLREKAFEKLVGCIEEYDYRLSTGFITTPMMMQTLVDFNRTDIAYRLLESTRFPSWLYLVKVGASTVWERWDAWTPENGFRGESMNSLDHVAFGAVGEWLYRHVLGINPDIRHPGYEHFTIQPLPGGTLTWARGSYNSIRGKIVSSWKIEDGKFSLEVEIPFNSSATVVMPNGETHEVGSGKYFFQL